MPSTSRFQLYGRKKSKPLKPRQQKLVNELLPRLRIALTPGEKLAPGALFVRPMRDIWLEIGFGGGEHLSRLASRHPAVGFIGAEPFLNGVAKLLISLTENNLDNIRVFDGDARALIGELAASTIGRVFALYPDPWPKRRHEKRRLFQPWVLAELHRIMRPGAELLLASDSGDYLSWCLLQFLHHGGFEWTAERSVDWREPPPDWAGTRYEAKALTEGRKPAYLSFRRKA
jgi:tRNA (guanine-N7-)-methyltransferase